MLVDGNFEASFNKMLAECNLRRSLQRSLKEPLKGTMKEPFKSAIVIRTLLFRNFHKKLEFLSLAVFYCLVLCLWVRSGRSLPKSRTHCFTHVGLWPYLQKLDQAGKTERNKHYSLQ